MMATDTYHVLPVEDLVEHEETEDCICGPRVEHVECSDGGDGWVVVHHSLDGRELDEDCE